MVYIWHKTAIVTTHFVLERAAAHVRHGAVTAGDKHAKFKISTWVYFFTQNFWSNARIRNYLGSYLKKCNYCKHGFNFCMEKYANVIGDID